jgi:nitroreductase
MAELMELGACAPFHYPCHESHRGGDLDSPAPWRFYALPGARCRELMRRLEGHPGKVHKILRLLAGADGLIVVTWLPDPAEGGLPDRTAFAATQRNVEHIAASAAATQNILLAATERGIENYWSSAGPVLGGREVLGELGVAEGELLLSAIFLTAQELPDAERTPGANRGAVGPSSSWSRWVED